MFIKIKLKNQVSKSIKNTKQNLLLKYTKLNILELILDYDLLTIDDWIQFNLNFIYLFFIYLKI